MLRALQEGDMGIYPKAVLDQVIRLSIGGHGSIWCMAMSVWP